MDFIRETLFESPLIIYMALGLAEIVTLAIWHQTRAPRTLLMLLLWPALAAGAALTAALVETDREQVQAAWSGIETAVAESNVEAMMEGVSDSFSTEGIDKPAFGRFVAAARQLMGANGVGFRGFTVERLETARAVTRVTAFYWPTKTYTEWQLVFVREAGRWRMQSAVCTQPRDLSLRHAMSIVSSAKGFR